MRELLDRILDDIRGAARFRWIAVVVAWAICFGGWLVIFSMPDRYESSARIFVDTRTALTPVLQGLAIQQDVSSQLSYVYQALTGTPQLEKIVRETRLDAARKSVPDAKAKAIEQLRRRVTVEVNNVPNGGAVFTIAYQNEKPERSLQVVEMLLNDFIENTLGGKQVDSQSAQKFLTEQIADYERRLRAAEEALADFKKRNVGLMPGEGGDHFAQMQREIQQKQTVESSLAVAVSRREELAKQLKGEAPAVLISQTTPTGGATPAADTSERIQEVSAQLDQLLLRFTDKHPDVVALRQTIEQLKQKRAAEMDALKRGDIGAAVESGATANPIYQSIQLALNQADVEIAALRRQLANHERRISELRALVNTVPEVEAEYARLNRDYSVTRAQYTALVERFERAKLGDEAQASGAVRFQVVDPPRTDITPVAPKRSLLIVAVLLFGLAAGAGVAYGLHLIRPVFDTSRAVYAATGLPVFGIVSSTNLVERRDSLRRSYFACATVAMLLLVAFVGVVKFSRAGALFLQQVLA